LFDVGYPDDIKYFKSCATFSVLTLHKIYRLLVLNKILKGFEYYAQGECQILLWALIVIPVYVSLNTFESWNLCLGRE